ncbi:hypothetical protein OSTOST_06548, partial [Ostertagia ostertagi]
PNTPPINNEVEQEQQLCFKWPIYRIWSATYRLSSVYLVAPMYRLATCQIEKNMATIRDATFCFLTNHTEFVAHKRRISTQFWSNKFCTDTFDRHSLDEAKETNGENMTLFAVVRHPIDRFLSGYVDKCHKKTKGASDAETTCGVSSKNYSRPLLVYYNDSIKRTRMTNYYVRHFAPQTCEYILINYHTGVNGTRRIADDFDKVYKQAQVPANLRSNIHSEML